MGFRLWIGSPTPRAGAEQVGWAFQRYDTTAGRGSALV